MTSNEVHFSIRPVLLKIIRAEFLSTFVNLTFVERQFISENFELNGNKFDTFYPVDGNFLYKFCISCVRTGRFTKFVILDIYRKVPNL